MDKRSTDISVSIVSYNTCDLLRACLDSLLARQADGEATMEITVADNGSSDGSPEMVRKEFPSVRLLEMGSNLGFGRANNAALADAQGRYFCLINSDAEALPHSLERAVAYLDQHPDVGSIGGQLLWPDGRLQSSHGNDLSLADVFAEQTFLKPILARLLPTRECHSGNRSDPYEVPQPSGAFMIIRNEAFRQVGGFDPAYFMYNEDVDLNWRLRRAGWRLMFLPDVHIRHHQGASSSADWRVRAQMVASNNRSRYYFFNRYQGRKAANILHAYFFLGTAIRLVGWSLLSIVYPAARVKVRLFLEVWRHTWAMRQTIPE